MLRRDWQLYRQVSSSNTPHEEAGQPMGKNRGDHREHAIDALVISLTDPERMQNLALHAKFVEEAWLKAVAQGHSRGEVKRKPLLPPWGDVRSFRSQVLSLVYDSFDLIDRKDPQPEACCPIIVSHRPTGRRILGRFHEDTMFGFLPDDPTWFTGHKHVEDLTPKHLRSPRHETKDEAIERLALRLVEREVEPDLRRARKRAKKIVNASSFTPRLVDPPPEKSGLVRDRELRRILRREIDRRLNDAGISRNADNFTASDLKRILKDDPLRMPSGVPIKRVVLLRTMNDPVLVSRKRYDYEKNQWADDESPRGRRAYVGGSNHHIEIREDAHGRWTGEIVMMYDVARRVRFEKRSAIDRSDDPARGGKFVMSLAVGDTIHMCHKDDGHPDYFVVFKLDKPQTIQLKRHWDARRATGEKDSEGIEVSDSRREPMAVSASQLKVFAPPGENTPIKIEVDPLGKIRRIEPVGETPLDTSAIDPKILEIARQAVRLRLAGTAPSVSRCKQRQLGSWTWMRDRLRCVGLEHLAPQLSLALRALKRELNG